ncbi:helix-turn-helix domain-containing protein [Geotalea toluenoxydans]|uniref:helix-turn-helix domain-containing protein n=1 Tax=Geotalea toluenoxydans TaxID=421624 RepID=UPI0006D0EF20|nr:helix-turn-helix transcriptional regulator [Geotalea toluenoxydans]
MKESNELRKIIGSRLALARQRAGLSQAQVAKELNIPRPSVSEIEAGNRKVSVEEMLGFADLYEVDMDWLSGKDADEVDLVRDRLQLAARQVANLKTEDLDKVIDLLTSLKMKDKK